MKLEKSAKIVIGHGMMAPLSTMNHGKQMSLTMRERNCSDRQHKLVLYLVLYFIGIVLIKRNRLGVHTIFAVIKKTVEI